MDPSEFKKILIDKDTFITVASNEEFINSYEEIALITKSSDILDANLYLFEIENGKKIKETKFKRFMQERFENNDMNEWIYISKRLVNINVIQQDYGMICCHVKDHTKPPVLGVVPDFEVIETKDVLKIKVLQKIS